MPQICVHNIALQCASLFIAIPAFPRRFKSSSFFTLLPGYIYLTDL